MLFPVIVHKDPGSDYGVIVPDFPGVFSGGASLEEALENVQEAVAMRFCDGEVCRAPRASSLETVLASPDAENGAVILLEIDPAPFGGEQGQIVHLPLPRELKRRIDDLADSLGLSGADLVAKALDSYQAR